jgi:pyochelin synthetase
VNHLEVLAEVEQRGLRLTVSGQDLRLQGPQQRVDPELISRIKAVKANLLAHLTAAGGGGFGLTLLQRGYLIGRGGSVELGNVASHVYHEIDGCWDIRRLEAALQKVVARQGMLRTRFTADGRQVTEPGTDVRVGRLDLRGQTASAQQARLEALREQRSHRVLPLDRAPLLAADVTLLADDRMRLHVSHDGLVMDGISMFLFFADWWRAYSDGLGPGGPEPVSAVSFADYVASLEAMRAGPAGQRSRDYWLARLDDGVAPRPALPLRGSPSAITRPRFTQHTVRLDPPSWAALKEQAASAGVTPTVALLAGYAQTLAYWGAGRRFTLTTTVAARPPIHPGITDAIGNFSQTLLVEIMLDPRAAFADRARVLQARLRADLDHRHFSGIEVLRELARRDPGADARMPFTFNSAIGYTRDRPAGGVPEKVDGSALELFGPEVYTSSQTPQLWLNAFAFECHGGVVVQFDEVTGLFPDGLIAAAVTGYQRLLALLSGSAAWQATSFDLLPDEQRARRRAANDTSMPVPAALLPEAFAAQAASSPDVPAILTTGGAVSYQILFQNAARAAAWLRGHGVRRDELVGLVMRRGPEQVAGILAVLMAGGAYLPADAGMPAERTAYMLRDGRVRCVLTNTGWRPAETGADVAVLDLGGGQLPSDVAGSSGPCLGGQLQAGVAGPSGPSLGQSQPADDGSTAAAGPAQWSPLSGATPDDLAYVLYTSGTTGEPKGVMISHASVANVVADCNERLRVGPADRFMAISAFSFDLSVYDVFGALSAGAALVMPDADRAADPSHWLELCDRFGVTIWNSVPAIVRLLAEQAEPGDPRLTALRLIMMSGDRIPAELPAALRRVMPGAALMSLGGPTETTIWNILHPIGADQDGEVIPYGRPNANNRAYLVDADGLDTPDWVTGEICAAGAGLARGYWNDEARTAARFSYDERRGERLFRTGDLGRYLPDGNIDILGRGDFQIKINGYRIEAGEVETRLAAIAQIKQAVVVRQPGADGDRLVAHLVPAGDARPGAEQVRQALRQHLPGYMLPSAVVWHDGLPLTRNGKVDRAKLVATTPQPAPAPGAGAGQAAGLHRELAGLWAPVLQLPASNIGPDADFYDLGGDSLAAARIFTAVRKRFGVGITLDQLHEVRTVRAMAAFVAAGDPG